MNLLIWLASNEETRRCCDVESCVLEGHVLSLVLFFLVRFVFIRGLVKCASLQRVMRHFPSRQGHKARQLIHGLVLASSDARARAAGEADI